jgi:uncharacterized protein (TIGR00251 family)
MIDINKHIREGSIKVFVKPGKKKTKIISFDDVKKALIIEVGAPAEDNKANVELVKFLSRQLKKRLIIKSGFTSKEKIILVKQ